MRVMKARTIADDLVDFLANNHGCLARVHSTFHHAVNLLIRQDELITLTNQGEIAPMGCMVECNEGFNQYLRPGDEVILDMDRIVAANGAFSVYLCEAQVWKSEIIADLDPRPLDELEQTTHQLTEWLGQQPALGLLPLLAPLTNQGANILQPDNNIYSRYIANDLKDFTDAMLASDWELALSITDRLLGFGMGSTPSCDDFLAANLLVLSLVERLNPGFYPWVGGFCNTVANKAERSTTLISLNMLRHAGNGKMSRSHQRLVQTCLFGDTGDLKHLANQVLQHGATSGGDFLLGLVCALNWYRNSKMDHSKEGEEAWVESMQSQPVSIL